MKKVNTLITMKNLITATVSGLMCFAVFAQKPNLEHAYKFKKVPKISLKNLRVPSTAGRNLLLDITPNNKLSKTNTKTSDDKKRGPANAIKNNLSVSGACTSQSGGIISSNDPRYDSCLDGSVYVKKVILTDPTQSILMNIELDGLNFNPFD